MTVAPPDAPAAPDLPGEGESDRPEVPDLPDPAFPEVLPEAEPETQPDRA